MRERRLRPRLSRATTMLLGGAALVAMVTIGAAQFWGSDSHAQTDENEAPISVEAPLLSTGADLVQDPMEGHGVDFAAVWLALYEAEGATAADSTTPPDDRRAAAKDGRFAMPLKAWTTFTDRYGAPRGRGLIHGGIDLSMEDYPQAPIYGACEGKVASAKYTSAYGNHVVVDCGDGWSTLYGHMSKMLVAEGEVVTFDTQLGHTGSTGYSTGEHLHFEIRWEGSPVNPEDYLDFKIPEGAPLSNGPIWFGNWSDGRVRGAAATSSGRGTTMTGGSGDGSASGRPEPTPAQVRPSPTPTPVPPTPTPRRAVTPTPKPVGTPAGGGR